MGRKESNQTNKNIQQFRRRCISKKVHSLTLILGSRSQICCSVPYASCGLFCMVCGCFIQPFRRRCIYKKIHSLTLLASRSHKMLLNNLYIMWPIHLHGLRLLLLPLRRRCFYATIHYWTVKLGVKTAQNVAQYPLHHDCDLFTCKV